MRFIVCSINGGIGLLDNDDDAGDNGDSAYDILLLLFRGLFFLL
jgi:hypothetical protein